MDWCVGGAVRERKMRTERESGILGPFFLGIKREKVSSVSERERESSILRSFFEDLTEKESSV